jgi:polysaccharide pyruvyl transferase WcaK-like protein
MSKRQSQSTSEAPRIIVGYLGWDDHGNMGDDAIRLTYERQLPQYLLRSLPDRPRHFPSFFRSTKYSQFRNIHLLLGGGTLIGKRYWRAMITGNLLLARGRPALMVGAGVEDPEFQGRYSGSSRGELRHWRRILARFDRITVRGPRSAELLARYDIEATVVGDPSLLLTTQTESVIPNLLGVTVGFGSDLWSHNQRLVIREVAEALALVHRRNPECQIRFLIVSVEDIEWTHLCSAALSELGIASDITPATNPEVFLSEVAKCQVFVGQRLHSVILASSCAVPSIMLEYQPKCLDFMRSIERAQWSLRTDRLTAKQLASLITDLFEYRAVHSTAIALQVAHLRAKLTLEFQRISEVLG